MGDWRNEMMKDGERGGGSMSDRGSPGGDAPQSLDPPTAALVRVAAALAEGKIAVLRERLVVARGGGAAGRAGGGGRRGGAACARRPGVVGEARRGGVRRGVWTRLPQAAPQPAVAACGAGGAGAGGRLRQGDRPAGARPQAARALHGCRGRRPRYGTAAALASARRAQHGRDARGGRRGARADRRRPGPGASPARAGAVGRCERAETLNAECGVRNAEWKGEVVPQADLKARTRAFALAIIQLVEDLRRGRSADVIGTQLLRAGTSVGANYRAACRARSRKEFVSKMGIVEEEADESQFWLDLAVERGLGDVERVAALRDEACQLVAIAVSSIRTARRTPRSIPHSAFRVPHSTFGVPRSP